MQRFRLMKVYVAAVLLVLIVAIWGAAWPGPAGADVTGTESGASPAGAGAAEAAADAAPGQSDVRKQNPGE
jgi:hypothetical protein